MHVRQLRAMHQGIVRDRMSQERAHIIAVRAVEHIMALRKQDTLHIGIFGLSGISVLCLSMVLFVLTGLFFVNASVWHVHRWTGLLKLASIEPFSYLMAVQLRAVATAIVACLACGVPNDTQLSDGDDETDLPNFQLLQHRVSVTRAPRGASLGGRFPGRFAEWIGKNGDSIRWVLLRFCFPCAVGQQVLYSTATLGLQVGVVLMRPPRSGSTLAVPPHLLAFPSWTWTAPHNALVRSSPIVDPNGDIYVSTSAGELFKFSREGQQLWKHGFKNHYVFANPVYYGHIYTLQDDCTFVAIDAKTGSTVWRRKAGYGSGPDTLSVIAAMGVVVSSCFGKGEGTSLGGATTVVALNATDGSMLWSFRAGYPLYNWIGSIQNDSLLFADFFGGTYRLSLPEGSVIWKVPPPSVTGATTGGLASGPNGVVYVTSNHEEIPNFRSGFVSLAEILASLSWTCPCPQDVVQKGLTLQPRSAYLVSDGSLLWRRNTTYAANAGAAISPGISDVYGLLSL